MSDEGGNGGGPRFINLTEDINPEKIDYAKLVHNIWNYIRNYTPDSARPQFNHEVLVKLLQKSQEILKHDEMVVKVNGPVIVFGPIYGEGDSLITLISQSKVTPPNVTFVMLGCYLGHGFAQLECLFLLLAYKLLYPEKVILLKGHHEESISMEMLKVKDWLYARGIVQEVNIEEVLLEMKKTCSLMSAAALVNMKILCMPGGPGPTMRERGLKQLMQLKKGFQAIGDRKLIMEAAWSVLLINEAQKDMHGMPFFTSQMASDFCKKNRLKCIVRGRQMVDEGYLNKPKEVITLISAVAYLDNFRNYAAVLHIEKDKVIGMFELLSNDIILRDG
uniref:SER_THR_PHOSPHATASE domain-containing protein n=1 Tax=Caenorhabditis tropicalis TaxID=1561998 RepID=A0A1I7TKL9_9PELO